MKVVFPEFGEVSMSEYLRPYSPEDNQKARIPLLELDIDNKYQNRKTMEEIQSPHKMEMEIEETGPEKGRKERSFR